MCNLLLVTGGIFCAVAGLIFLPLPTPFGIPLLIAASGLILAGSATARKAVKDARAGNRRLHGWLLKAERYLPAYFKRPLEQTRPHRGDR